MVYLCAKKRAMKIVFLGTPDFAVESLKSIIHSGYEVVGVVTTPDKKAGRGMKLQESAVKKYAVSENLKVLQPVSLKDEAFLAELKSLDADLQVIVAFRMLPEAVWDMPKYGTFNLHGSLLPNYRGAAPINWAIINGEQQTGVTTFFLDHNIDTGEIIDNRKVNIGENQTAGELHDELMVVGAELVVETIKKIENNTVTTQKQEDILNGAEPKFAYKIFKETCSINWSKTSSEVHNHIRGLSPYPAAFTTIKFSDGTEFGLKIFKSEKAEEKLKPGEILTDQKKSLLIGCSDGAIRVLELQLAGKKRMPVQSFLQGIKLEGASLIF